MKFRLLPILALLLLPGCVSTRYVEPSYHAAIRYGSWSATWEYTGRSFRNDRLFTDEKLGGATFAFPDGFKATLGPIDSSVSPQLAALAAQVATLTAQVLKLTAGVP